MATHQAIRASRIDHALGVQTDLTSGNWSTIPTMISQAQYIGAETVRVYVPTAGNWTTRYGYTDQLANAGLKLDLIADTADTPANNVAAIANFITAHPGSVALVEGPNEPNNTGVQYGGLSGVAGAQAWQRDFYAALNANPVTASLPVAGVSSWPYVAAASDENNLHIYPNNGDQPLGALTTTIAQQNAVDPNKPFAITEMGWATLPGARPEGANMAGVDQATQAKLLLNAYMDSASLGATHIGLYSLRDWANTDFYAHFGLFYNNDTPKPAAVALHNLQSILNDSGAAADSFTPGSLDYSVSASADVRSMLIQKSSGEFVLALWREPDIWNEASGTPIQAAGESAVLRLGPTMADARIYDPLVGAAAVSTAAGVSSLTVTVADHPVFVALTAIRDAAGGGGAAAANLLVNGSFEAGPSSGDFTTLGAGSTAIAGWTVTRGNIDDIHNYWQAADGGNSLDMNGNTAGAIAQTFATTAGVQYDVRFFLAANPGDQAVHGLHVAAAGQAQDFHANGAGQSQSAMGWSEQTFRFTAGASSTTLEFSGLDASYWGAALDHVSVTAVAPLAVQAPAPAPKPAVSLLVNGSFEAGPSSGDFTTLGAGSTAIAGWTVTRGNIDDIHNYWQAADGGNSLDMNGNTAGAIAQTFATTAGVQYDVRFFLAANPGDQAVHGLHVAAAGQAQDFHANGAGHSQSAMGWSEQTFRFTAGAASTTLEFSGLDAYYWGAALDHVSVFAVDPLLL